MDKEDAVHIYALEYYSALKKNEVMTSAAILMDLEIIILSEVSQTGKKNIKWYNLHDKFLQKDENELTYKTQIDPQT